MSAVTKNILHVTHFLGGGMHSYISDLQLILGDSYNIFTLKRREDRLILECPRYDEAVLCFKLNVKMGQLETRCIEYQEAFEKILLAYDIDLVHVNITLGHSFDVFYTASSHNIPVVYTVHDFFYICPTFHVVDQCGMYCHICAHGKENAKCIQGHPYVNNPLFDENALYNWRNEFELVKDKISKYIFPSESCREVFTSFYDIDSDKCSVIQHGANVGNLKNILGDDHHGLRVGILGTMLKHKGELIYKYILDNVDDDRIRFYHFGGGKLEHDKLNSIGRYTRIGIVDLLTRNKIDVVMLLSTWPETFSYTLSESITAHIPVIVSNLGALNERVIANDIGWVINYDTPQKACDLLISLAGNKSALKEKVRKINQMSVFSLRHMKNAYIECYSMLLEEAGRKKTDIEAIKSAESNLKIIKSDCSPEVEIENDDNAFELLERGISCGLKMNLY